VAILLIFGTNQAMAATMVAKLSENVGAKIKTSLVVAECGSRSSGVKNQAAEKKIATMAVTSAKVVEIMRGLDLSRRAAIASRPTVGGMQFHKMI
jgi:hypothetical protein